MGSAESFLDRGLPLPGLIGSAKEWEASDFK